MVRDREVHGDSAGDFQLRALVRPMVSLRFHSLCATLKPCRILSSVGGSQKQVQILPACDFLYGQLLNKKPKAKLKVLTCSRFEGLGQLMCRGLLVGGDLRH